MSYIKKNKSKLPVYLWSYEILSGMGASRTFNRQRTRCKRSETTGNVNPASASNLPQVDPDPQCEREFVVTILPGYMLVTRMVRGKYVPPEASGRRSRLQTRENGRSRIDLLYFEFGACGGSQVDGT